MAHLIEDDALAAAASELLRKRGQTLQGAGGDKPI